MRKALFSTVVVLALLVAAGCDSQEDEETDADRIVGEWELEAVSDETGDRTVDFEQLGVFTAEFDEDLDFVLEVDSPDPESGTFLGGTYTLNTITKSLLLQGTTPTDQGFQFLLEYRFTDDDELELSIPDEAITIVNQLLQFDFEGNVEITLVQD